MSREFALMQLVSRALTTNTLLNACRFSCYATLIAPSYKLPSSCLKHSLVCMRHRESTIDGALLVERWVVIKRWKWPYNILDVAWHGQVGFSHPFIQIHKYKEIYTQMQYEVGAGASDHEAQGLQGVLPKWICPNGPSAFAGESF